MLKRSRLIHVIGVLMGVLVIITSVVPIHAQESPDSPVPITPENAHRLRQVAVFGGGRITQPVWSPDGHTIAVAGTQGVWFYDAEDVQTAPILFKLDPGEGEVTSLAYSPNGVWLATGSATGETRLWSLETGESEIILTRNDVGRGRSSVAFSPDGKLLAVGDDATIHLYDMAGRLLQPSLEDVCDGYVASLAFSPDGSLLACGTTSLGDASAGMVGIWDLAAERGLHTIRMDWMWMVTANVAFSADGESLYIWDSEQIGYYPADLLTPAHAPVRHWDLTEQVYLPLPDWWQNYTRLAFAPSAELALMLMGRASTLEMRNTDTDGIVLEIGGETHAKIDGFAFDQHSKGKRLAFVRQNRLQVATYDPDVPESSRVRSYPSHHSGVISNIDFSGDSRYLTALSAVDNWIQVWDVVTGESRMRSGDEDYRFIAHAIGEQDLTGYGIPTVVITEEGTVFEWKVPEFRPMPWLGKLSQGAIFDVTYTSDDGLVVLGCGVELINHIIENHMWYKDITFITPNACVNAYLARFRRDLKTFIVATSGPDAHLALYYSDLVELDDVDPDDVDPVNDQPPRLIRRWQDTELITAVDLSLSGGLVAVGTGYEGHGGGGIETSLTLLKTDGDAVTLVTPRDTYACTSPLSIVRGLAFSPDDRLLAVASGDSLGYGLAVQVWDVQTESPLVTLEGHTDIILDVAFSPDGSMLATAGKDGTIRLWAVGDTPYPRTTQKCPSIQG